MALIENIDTKQWLEFAQSGEFWTLIQPTLMNIIIAVVIYLLGSFILRRLQTVLRRLLARKSHDQSVNSFVFTSATIAFKFFLFVLMLEQLGINTTSLLALLGAAGLAISLAIKDSLANFASGVMLIILKPFKSGDYINIGSTEGKVEKISLFSTLLVSSDNKEIIIPNAKIYQGSITNYTARSTRRIELSFTVSYQAPLAQVKKEVYALIAEDERILFAPEPQVVVAELNDAGVRILIYLWTNNENISSVRWRLLEAIKLRFEALNIHFAAMRHEVKINENAS